MATLGPDPFGPATLTWTNVENTINTTGARVRAGGTSSRHSGRAEHDLDTVNHAAQIETYENGLGSHRVGVCLRFSSSATTFYLFRCDTDSNDVTIAKVVDGLGTDLVIVDDAFTWANGAVLRGEVNGSNLRLLMDGIEIATATDSEITTGTRVGISIFTNQVSRAEGDNFFAEDLGGAPPPTTSYVAWI